ncbi:MAG TPA: cytochrome C oxidase subunit IV family protein [Gemmatimonadota bacterium]|nr:cytochrome C oxidase subunit IV family protein [Gemmatimonadota bacterium]
MADESVSEEAVERKRPNYYLVWVYLLILTVAEVVVAFMSNLPETWLILLLLFLAVWKAALVAMYYMHLKFEPPRLVLMVLAPIPFAILITFTVVVMEIR